MENESLSRNGSKWLYLRVIGLSKIHHIPPNQTLRSWILASLIYSLSNPNYSSIFSSHIITKIIKCTTEKSDSFFFQLKSVSSCLPYVHPFPKQANYILLVLPKYDFRVNITPTYKWDVFPKFVLQVSSLKPRISFPEEINLKNCWSFPDQRSLFNLYVF